MKKLISVILALTLVISAAVVFTACKKQGEGENADVNADESKVFKEATEDLTGASYEEIAYLGRDGENYAYLAAGTATIPDASTNYAVVKISEKAGKAEIAEIIDSNAAVLMDSKEPVSGGWAKCKDTAVTDEAKKALEKACETLAGATYNPVALLGTQIVAGTNYMLMCEMTATVPDAKTNYAIVTVYEDLEGKCEIINTVEFVTGDESESDEGASEASSEENTESIANPVVDYENYEEAEKAAGFGLDTPDLVSTFFSVIDGKIFQITCEDTYIRKAKGSDDISGDYNDYPEVKTETVFEKEVTFKGENGKINLITWTDGGYSFCVGFKSGTSRSNADLFIEWVK